jgi:hypothetical protein
MNYKGDVAMHAERQKRGSRLGLILRAIRGPGITLTVVETCELQNPITKKTANVTKVGILAEKCLSIFREELINRKPCPVDTLDANIPAQDSNQNT